MVGHISGRIDKGNESIGIEVIIILPIFYIMMVGHGHMDDPCAFSIGASILSFYFIIFFYVIAHSLKNSRILMGS